MILPFTLELWENVYAGRHLKVKRGDLYLHDVGPEIHMHIKQFNIAEGKYVYELTKELPESDKEVFYQPNVKQQHIDTIREAFHSGTRGVPLDYSLTVRPWGFKLEDISIEVHLWHGEDDTVVPSVMG